jgi:hypothetical protein
MRVLKFYLSRGVRTTMAAMWLSRNMVVVVAEEVLWLFRKEDGGVWSGFVGEIRSIDIFQTSFGDGQIAPSPFSKEHPLMPAVMLERAPTMVVGKRSFAEVLVG